MTRYFYLIIFFLLLAFFAACCAGCTFQNVRAINQDIILDLQSGIAKIDARLEEERSQAWDEQIAAIQGAYESDLALAKSRDKDSPDKLLADYEALKMKTVVIIEESATMLDKRMKDKRQNLLGDFLNALASAQGIETVLGQYAEPDWASIEALAEKASKIIGLGAALAP